ncbi:MAG: hypothetical protein A2Y33_16045 [Spirochaetes bacterium GWF1_51_8]|nr:MAG: hypothetical protein A2Y33_16045 [Spirochaetes bacterium GWF1_51_8]
MKTMLPLSILAILTLNACQSDTVPDKPIKIEEGQTQTAGGMEIKVERVLVAYYQDGDFISDQTSADISINKNGKTIYWNAVYGEVTNVFGYRLTLKFCAIGRTEWKSYADILVEKD